MKHILSRNELPKVLEKWSKAYTVYAAQKYSNFSAFLPYAGKTEALCLEYPHNTRYPPKALFMPQSEALLRYTKEGKASTTEPDKRPKLIFGMHACDARAMTLLDTVFDTEEYPDPFWKARRNSTAVITLGCDEPCSTCFCTTVEGGPFNHEGADVMMTDIGSAFYLEALSPKGQKLCKGLPQASEEETQKALEAQKKAKKMPKAFETEGLKASMDAHFESSFWEDMQRSCLGCGVCTFLCPTCFCFDIADEASRSARFRNWDTCMFPVYSREASGHNPRPTRKERTRQRLMHKYSYWVDQIGKIGCTGCGRCVRYCPVGLDIRAMLRQAGKLPAEVKHAA
ncbi:MAG: 4Fe-4S dicluster domain-containing protein [Anaerolineaceae bacterium]|nr:4Fe-4S dicluster domain-containing protein [Anaerolineaceae bacterium]